MNYLYLTWLFAIGATIELSGAVLFLGQKYNFVNIVSFLLFSGAGIHYTLVFLFYDMYEKKRDPNLKQVFLTVFNILYICSCSYIILYVLWK